MGEEIHPSGNSRDTEDKDSFPKTEMALTERCQFIEENKTNDCSQKDPVVEAIGEIGPWQIRMLVTMGLFYMAQAWSLVIMPFLSARVDFWCQRPPELKDMPVQDWKSLSGQIENSCAIYDRNYSQSILGLTTEGNWSKIPCAAWEFDKSQFESTINSDFGIVCDQEYKKSISQSAFFFGQVTGAILCGIISDKFGRKTAMIPVNVLLGVSGLMAAYSPTYNIFVFSRFLSGIFKVGSYEAMFSFLLEVVGTKYSPLMSQGFFCFFVGGYLTSTILAFFARNWRTLSLITALPNFLAIFLIWLVPESPKWLLVNGKVEKADKLVRLIAKRNGRSEPTNNWHLNCAAKECPPDHWQRESGHFWDLFKYAELRKKTFCLHTIWLVTAMSYYGLAFMSIDLVGNVFINHLISGLTEFPSYGGALLVMSFFGRRSPSAVLFLVAGLTLLSTLAFARDSPRDRHWDWAWVFVGTTLFGKMVTTLAYGILYAFTVELFPTEIRATGLGMTSFMGRVGGFVAPWVMLLENIFVNLPVIVFGLLTLAIALVVLLLPETRNTKMPDTIAESEQVRIGCRPFCSGSKTNQDSTTKVDEC